MSEFNWDSLDFRIRKEIERVWRRGVNSIYRVKIFVGGERLLTVQKGDFLENIGDGSFKGSKFRNLRTGSIGVYPEHFCEELVYKKKNEDPFAENNKYKKQPAEEEEEEDPVDEEEVVKKKPPPTPLPSDVIENGKFVRNERATEEEKVTKNFFLSQQKIIKRLSEEKEILKLNLQKEKNGRDAYVKKCCDYTEELEKLKLKYSSVDKKERDLKKTISELKLNNSHLVSQLSSKNNQLKKTRNSLLQKEEKLLSTTSREKNLLERIQLLEKEINEEKSMKKKIQDQIISSKKVKESESEYLKSMEQAIRQSLEDEFKMKLSQEKRKMEFETSKILEESKNLKSKLEVEKSENLKFRESKNQQIENLRKDCNLEIIKIKNDCEDKIIRKMEEFGKNKLQVVKDSNGIKIKDLQDIIKKNEEMFNKEKLEIQKRHFNQISEFHLEFKKEKLKMKMKIDSDEKKILELEKKLERNNSNSSSEIVSNSVNMNDIKELENKIISLQTELRLKQEDYEDLQLKHSDLEFKKSKLVNDHTRELTILQERLKVSESSGKVQLESVHCDIRDLKNEFSQLQINLKNQHRSHKVEVQVESVHSDIRDLKNAFNQLQEIVSSQRRFRPKPKPIPIPIPIPNPDPDPDADPDPDTDTTSDWDNLSD